MARKSILKGLKKSGAKPITTRTERAREAFDLSWLKLTFQRSTVDISQWYHHKADATEPRVEGRAEFVNKIAKGIQNKIKDSRSEITYAGAAINFRRYIKFCDNSGFEPFSKEGYLEYVGDRGELRRRITIFESKSQLIYQADDGDPLGFSESTAKNQALHIRTILKLAGVHCETWERLFDSFTDNERELTIAYNSDETDVSVKLLLHVFDGLYNALLQHYQKDSQAPLPKELTIKLGSGLGELYIPETGNRTTPFNLCMAAGYALFAYYTGLNRDVALNAAHPIEFEKRRLKEKTVKRISLSLWKARAGKFVSAELTDDVPVHDINDNEFDVEIEKKTGVTLVEKLVKLAEMFGSTDKGASLFFHLDANDNVIKFNTDSVRILSSSIDLRKLDTSNLSVIISDALLLALESKFYKIKSVTADDTTRFVSKKIVSTRSYKTRRNVVSCAAMLLANYNSPASFYGAKIPLLATETEDEVTYHFTRMDGSKGSFSVPKEYQPVIAELEAWARKQDFNEEVFLLPFPKSVGDRRFEWRTPQRLPSMHKIIADLAIPHGQYYLNLTTRRFRALMAKDSYSDEDLGTEGSLLLDNDLDTFQTAYSDGDPEENQLIMYEALEVVSRIFKGATKEEAIAAVLASLGRETLTFDEVKKTKLHINQNGIACRGIPDIDREMGGDHHRSAAKAAEKLGLSNAGKVPCYQLDQCARCKSAKMVDDVNQVYKLLSFITILEERVNLRPDDESLLETAAYFRLLVDENISDDVLNEAHQKLYFDGLHPLVEKMQAAQIIT
ncbi:hypothetical protein L4D76_18475 [Photobacterium sagamiensis]|uniref:hypothetical protein n=1 Tax=Photobacterium sagamiensis TaxID=2910241 RepID=UPI003D0B233C